MTRSIRLQTRNQKVRDYMSKLEKKHPQWRYDALLKDTAETFFISTRTVEAIVRREGCYAD